ARPSSVIVARVVAIDEVVIRDQRALVLRAHSTWRKARYPPISRVAAWALGLDIPIEASQSNTSHAPTKVHVIAFASTASRSRHVRLRALRLAARSAFEMISRASAAALRSAARRRSWSLRVGRIRRAYSGLPAGRQATMSGLSM